MYFPRIKKQCWNVTMLLSWIETIIIYYKFRSWSRLQLLKSNYTKRLQSPDLSLQLWNTTGSEDHFLAIWEFSQSCAGSEVPGKEFAPEELVFWSLSVVDTVGVTDTDAPECASSAQNTSPQGTLFLTSAPDPPQYRDIYLVVKKWTFFLSFFVAWQIPNLITGRSGR